VVVDPITVVLALTGAGIPAEEIQTESLMVGREQEQRGMGSPTRTKYSAEQQWHIHVVAADAQKVVDIAVSAGANTVQGVEWNVSDPQTLRAILQSTQLNGRRPSILLAHQPSNPAIAAEAGISLQLSGHTHGGQIRLRETKESILFPRRRRRLASGLHAEGDTQIYITRGVGTVVLPVRYGCPPEVSVIELRKENV